MHPANLEIDLLRTFVAVADTGSFTAAGDVVARTQSAVSVQIKRLEELLGARVFERTSRSLSLTRPGDTLLGYARRMLELNDESMRAITRPPLAGEMRIGISEYFQPRQIGGMLVRFAQRYPQAHLEVRIGLSRALKDMMAAGELDVVIGRVEASGRAPVFWREPLHWVAARDVVLVPGEPVPLLVLPPGCVLRDQAMAMLRKQKRSWRIALSASGMTGLQAALEAGLGVSILPASLLQPTMRVLTRKEGFPDPGEQQLAFFERRGISRELAQAFRDVVQERLDVLAASAGATRAQADGATVTARPR